MRGVLKSFGWPEGQKVIVFGDVRAGVALAEQVDELQEDMVQVEYSARVCVDVGWYPEYNLDGRFVVYVIVDCEWDEPELKLEARTVAELEECLRKADERARAIF